MHGGRVQQRADHVQRADDLLVAAAPNQRPARRRGVQAQDHPHRGRLPGAVGPQEPGHMPRAHREAQVIHRRDRPEALGQLVHLDHDRADRNTPGKQRPIRGNPSLLGQRHACCGPGLPEDQVNKAAPGHRDTDDHRPHPLGQVAHLASPGQVDQAPSSKRNRHGQHRYRHGAAAGSSTLTIPAASDGPAPAASAGSRLAARRAQPRHPYLPANARVPGRAPQPVFDICSLHV